MRAHNGTNAKKHILTVSVEDYFHVASLRGAILRKHWDRLEPHLDANMHDVLELLERFGHKATFFVLGSIAEMQPELVQRIMAGGHEVASSGYFPRSMHGTSPMEFRKEVRRTKEILEDAGANRIVGYRSPSWLQREDLWMLDVLAEEGYLYDSSINPVLRRFAGDPVKYRIHQHRHSARDMSLWEFPITTVSIFGMRLAISGGNYIRQFPHALLSRAVARHAESEEDPVVFYFMPWEIDRKQPDIQGISRLQHIRHYRNLGKTRWVLEDYFARLKFQGIADYLRINHAQPAPKPERPRAIEISTVRQSNGVPVEPVTLVVPLFNEEQNIKYLHRTLLNFRKRLSERYRIHLVLVDDRSTDDTWTLLNMAFEGVPDCQIVRHEKNQGVAGAMMTGIQKAPTEIVCSIDCDCSYDPHNFEEMIPLIKEAEMVTASPYHPAGHVLNVPGWRLFLSKSLSRMYSAVLHERLHTFTSCCRVYRKSALQTLTIKNGGFLGVAEMLIELKLRGGRVVEYPATLESRLLGHSKMKIARTIYSHLTLLNELALGRGKERRPTTPGGGT
jgi:polysaccharide deacetylase family protein (PEP-CTERM system associated)